MSRLAMLLAACSLCWSCSSNSGGNGSPGGHSPDEGGTDGGSNVTSCDDAIACTLDTIVNGRCTHSVGPNSGATACPDGKYCTVKDGCVSAPACATDADCSKAWADDPCKGHPRCDGASSVCIFDPLDKDGDGHSPLVCGGDDCDDSSAERYPGFLESNPAGGIFQDEKCDGIDNNCDGKIDNGAACGALETCENGACTCLTANACGSACVDKETDQNHCGSCGHECSVGGTCQAGACSCLAGETDCGGVCTDTSSDTINCGSCGNGCPTGATCTDSVCVCPDGGQACGQACVDVSTDPANCGKCGTVCVVGGSCVAGACSCPAGPCPTVIASGLRFPTAVAVDSGYVYWGVQDERGRGLIQRRALSGGAVEQVLSIGVAGDYIRTLSLSASEIFFTTNVPSCSTLCGEAGWVDKVGFGRHYVPVGPLGRWMPVGFVGTDTAAYLLDYGYVASGTSYFTSGSLVALSPLTSVATTTLSSGGGTLLAMQGDTLYVGDPAGVAAVPLTGTGWYANVATSSIKWTLRDIAVDTSYVYGVRAYTGSELFRIPIGGGTLEAMQTSITGGTHLSASGGFVYVGGTEILKVGTDGTATQLASALDVQGLTIDTGNVYWTNGKADGAVLSIAR